MTDRAAPGAQGSTVRNMEYGEMGGAPAPFLVPFSDGPTRSTQRWNDLDDPASNAVTDRGPFNQKNRSDGDNYIILNPGEGYVDGWFATDEAKQTPDLSPYQQEEITLVVGWDPDAVYSSDIHSTREEADAVFVGIEQDVSDDMPYIRLFRCTPTSDGSGGFKIDDEPLTDLRPIGRPIETLDGQRTLDQVTDVEGGGSPGVTLLRGSPTTFTGGVSTGPQEVPANHPNFPVINLPVTAELTAGDPVGYQFNLSEDAVLSVEGEADGNGGVQNVTVAFNDTPLSDPSNNVGGDSMTADPESATEDGYIEVDIDGTTRQIPFYDA